MRTVTAADLHIGDEYPPRIMGVVNISPESPYEPSVHDTPAQAASYIETELLDEGADIIDIGVASANKRLDVISVTGELDRLETAIETIDLIDASAVFSIETRYHEVADKALDNGFDMVNDISGFADPQMPVICEKHDAAVVKMAGSGDINRPGALRTVDDIYSALSLNGFTDKTIIDPAFGQWRASNTLDDDHQIFRRLREFNGLNRPMLISINRKNFLGDIVDRPTEERLPASLAATALAVERGANVIRTHDVATTRDAAKIGHFYRRDRVRSPGVTELDVTTVSEAERHLTRLGLDTGLGAGCLTKMYEVDGLTESDSVTLRDAAAETGAVIGINESRGVLAGTPVVLNQLAAKLTGSRRGDVLSRIVSAVRQ